MAFIAVPKRRQHRMVLSVPRAVADLVVTKNGIAELRGRMLAERARALTAIAPYRAFSSNLENASDRLR